jgi:hypothetical protein
LFGGGGCGGEILKIWLQVNHCKEEKVCTYKAHSTMYTPNLIPVGFMVAWKTKSIFDKINNVQIRLTIPPSKG